MINYLKEVMGEVKNIKWPTNKIAIAFTVGVILLSFITGIYLGALDFVFTEITNRFILQ